MDIRNVFSSKLVVLAIGVLSLLTSLLIGFVFLANGKTANKFSYGAGILITMVIAI